MNKEIEQQIHEFAELVYKTAYNKGYEDRDANLQEQYEKGLNEAWECARKITGKDIDTEEVFGDIPLMFIFRKYSASEAIAQIKEWERRTNK